VQFVLVLEFVQFGVVKYGWSSMGGQVWVFRSGCYVNSWFPFIDGVSLPTTSR
jgi:hypothetical protein